MTGSLLDRALRTIELLALQGPGLKLHDISERLNIPKSAAHHLLGDLIEHGYVRQDADTTYRLTTKVVSLGNAWLASSGATGAVQPTLDRLAAATGELVRYAAVDGEKLTWVAKSQGARFGLRVDPDPGTDAVLYCTATGHAWLASHDDDAAIRLVMLQGFGRLSDHGPNAPRTVDELRKSLEAARARGYATAIDSNAPGISSIAVVVRHPLTRGSLGVLSISGPSLRLTEHRIRELAPELLEAAAELAVAGTDALPQLSVDLEEAARQDHASKRDTPRYG